MLAWCKDNATTRASSRQGKPIQNAFVESFNGQMRDEFLNETLFFGPDDTRRRLAAWVTDCSGERPLLAQYQTPAAYAANLTATDDRLRNPDQLRRRPLLDARQSAYNLTGL